MPLSMGSRLGPYEITSAIGAGGMGEVYRARDTRLDRTVAIKILPDHSADRSELRERFEREARTIASLNHPHICTLHDIGHQDGTDFLVMEYLEGETLAQRLTKSPLSLEQVLQYAIQIADALDKAHRKGVTHRDLKPGNIMLTKSGAKLLDFGLAKLRQEASPATGVSQMPTRSQPITAQGTIVGTLQYMAPEQLEGKEADARTDIFAFGAVVYEMATGKRAFEGKSQASVMAKILEIDPPPISSLQPMTPSALDRAVKKCLAKDPDERWQNAGDLRDELKWIADSRSEATTSSNAATGTMHASWRHVAVWSSAAFLIAAAIAGFVVWNLKSMPPAPRPVTRFTITLPAGQRLVGLPQQALALSRDGSQLAYVATEKGSPPRIYVRRMDKSESQAVSGTEGASGPFFSPHGQWLGFFADGKLKKVPVRGGVAQALANVGGAPRGASWGSQHEIVFAPPVSGLLELADGGGAPEPLTSISTGEAAHIWPQWLPGDQAVLFVDEPGTKIAVQLIGTNKHRSLLQGQIASTPRYVSSGHLIYVQSGDLMAAPFDPQKLEVTSAAVPVVQGVLDGGSVGVADYSVSATGTLVYVPGGTQALAKLVWVSRNGTEQPIAAPVGDYDMPRLSPDGRQIAVDIRSTDSTQQVGLFDLARDTLSQFTFAGSLNEFPTWTPDGKRIAFMSNRQAGQNIFWQQADGSGGLERLTNSDSTHVPFSFSPDGRQLTFVEVTGNAKTGIQVLQLGDSAAGSGKANKARTLLKSHSFLDAPQISPDGHWLAYASDESARREIYVQPFPSLGGKWQISNDGGTEPLWSRNGRELFYRNGDKMMSVKISTQGSFVAGKPRQLFEGDYLMNSLSNARPNYDVSADGQRFLMVAPAGQGNSPMTQINVVLNWTEELKRLVPSGNK